MAITTNISVVADSGGDYTTLVAWEAGEQRDLTATGDGEIEHCKISGTFAAAETSRTYLAGWTCDATRYILVEALDDGARHDGTYTNTAHRIETTDTHCVYNNEFHSKIVGLQGVRTATSATSAGAFENGVGGDDGYFDSCIGVVKCTSGLAKVAAFREGDADSSPQAFVFVNCIAYSISTTPGAEEYGFMCNLSYAKTILNCTAVGMQGAKGDGFFVDASHTLKNCLASGNANDDYSAALNAASATCAASDTSLSGGSGHRTEQTFTFVDADNDDYHLHADDAGARTYGTDLSGVFTTDIDGDTRSDWDIGADEYSAGAPPEEEEDAVEQFVRAGIVAAVRSLMKPVTR